MGCNQFMAVHQHMGSPPIYHNAMETRPSQLGQHNLIKSQTTDWKLFGSFLLLCFSSSEWTSDRLKNAECQLTFAALI